MNHLRIILALLSLLLSTAIVHGQGCSGDINGDGKVDGVDLATVLAQWGNCPANITSVSPSQGSVLGGTVITISGAGLASTTGVRVGGVLCANLQVLSSTQVRATTPPGAAGQAAIEVTTPAGTALAPTSFAYSMQSVTSISPARGPYLGSTPITIEGQYLSGVTAVSIGGVPVTDLVVVNSTTLTAVTPAGSVGAVNVVVAGAKGSISIPGGFTYVAPPAWATVLEWIPDPVVVPIAALRNQIIGTGMPWRVRDNASQIEMLLVPPGTFEMGCSLSLQSQCSSDELPVHAVTLTNPFYLGRYEVTQSQWTAVMGSNPSYFRAANGFPESDSRPVETVFWNSVQGFVTATGLRLPTEAEWEYAYRAGTTTAFHSMPGFPEGTSDESMVGNIGWFAGNTPGWGTPGFGTKPVGQKAPNALGFYDMSGNVFEWTNDWFSPTYYAFSPSADPLGPTSGTVRLQRGGGFLSQPPTLRSSARWTYNPGGASFVDVGVRVARNP
jgi:formylglycine-generating enzyme required for sulfatase activity